MTGEPLGLLPFVPGGPHFQLSRDLFHELGFQELWANEGYVGLQHGAAKFILQDLDNGAFAGNLMVRIDVPDLEAWWRRIEAMNLASRFPSFRIKPPITYPWGREVHFIDLAGVCWHVGEP